jgi:murein DD-endopeptidase MepM/ murein hydrolase activator NlpD
MPHGTPIIAARDGVVKRADSVLHGYGKLVILSHGKGIETRYAHCSEFAVEKGDTVIKGQVIAYVGKTGNTTADHLHFEILINGLAYNPLRFLDENQLSISRQFTKK